MKIDTDTRAALDAATLALIEAATEEGKAWGLHSLPSGDDSTYANYSRANEARGNAEDDIKAAITAHVEAEVARRLAVAPSVEEAIATVWCDCDHGARCGKEIADDDHSQGRRGSPGDQDDCDCATGAHLATLRAAIAADRERAVAEATDGAVQGERFAAEICRLVGARETGAGGQTVDACTASLYANASKRIDRMIARNKARPTPDEARRLVGEFAGAHGAMVAHLAGMTGPESGEDVAARAESTRTALLRALGVEA